MTKQKKSLEYSEKPRVLADPWVERFCPAKLNLSLHIRGRRSDGYHLLTSLFAKINYGDTLRARVTEASGVQLTCPGREDLQTPDNLICRAARVLLPAGAGIAFELNKRLPLGGGLGGGSSNAAAALLLIDQLFALGSSARQLTDVAAQIGADVPFFVGQAPCAMVTGVGEKLRPLSRLAPVHLLLLISDLQIATPWAYRAFDQLAETPRQDLLTLSSRNDKNFSIGGRRLTIPQGIARLMHNDLESAVFGRYPQLAERKAMLLQAGALAALMSGSGASVFGLFENQQAAGKAHAALCLPEGVSCLQVSTLTEIG